MNTIWSPGYFGINFALSATGGNTTPPPPPPTGGSPVTNSEAPVLRMAA